MYLSTNEGYMFGHPISGQAEVCGVTRKSRDTEWYAAEGVYLPRTDVAPNTDAAETAADKQEL